MYNTQYSQVTDTHALGWIRTNDTINPKLEKGMEKHRKLFPRSIV